MQIRNKIYIKKYVLGTFLNFFCSTLGLGINNLSVIIIFFLCLVLNQFFLIAFGAKSLGLDKGSIFLPTPVLVIGKLLLLAFAFNFALIKLGNMVAFLVISYIFQLIILAISTKRIVKNIKDKS